MLHKALEGAIIFETFPKTTVDVFALVLESGGANSRIFLRCKIERLPFKDLFDLPMHRSASIWMMNSKEDRGLSWWTPPQFLNHGPSCTLTRTIM